MRSMAAYAALLSLSQTTQLNTNHDYKSLFSIYAEETIQSIHEYASFLLSFLEDFPEKADRWEGKIRDVANKAQDIVDVFMWQRIQSSHEKMMTPSSIKLEEELENVTEEIGLIAGEVMDERPADLPAAVSSSPSPSRFEHSTASDAVIGLDEDVMTMKDRLCGHSSHLQVIPIVGIGGIGKTTLVTTVYDDPLILERFDIRAWLTVSQDYTPQKLRQINLSCAKMSTHKIDEFEMKTKIFQHLKGRRYLVVLDDVWSTEVWDDVRHIFPDDGNGSRIMLTTRLLDVAAYPDPYSPIHEMQFFNDYQSWMLLQKKVFRNSNCPIELEEAGKKIARNCAGLPLAVVLVAGIMSAINKTPSSWEGFVENENPIAGREIEEILYLSYTQLPHQLRPCFLFIGGFPEDENIHASTLIRLWVAEGFLKHQDGCCKSLEEEAEYFLEDLVKRNLVIVTRRKSNGKIKSCKLHDMVRDMCIKKTEGEKFLHIMDRRVVPQGMTNERRISYSRCDIDNIWGPTIRTIMCFKLQNLLSWPAFLQRSRLVRVLKGVGNHHNVNLPSQVFELFHLRYLALVGSSHIPSAISDLIHLQTLIIHPTFHRKASPIFLPLEIWSMRQLRHIIFDAPYLLTLPQDGSYQLLPIQNLQTLSSVTNIVWNEKMVHMIPNVKKLGLVYTISEDCHLHHLKYLHQLENLQVTGHDNFSWREQSPSFPRTLKKLKLVGGEFPLEDMSMIGSLPNLQVLKLLNHACDGATWETNEEEFPELEHLVFQKSRLQQWITHSSSTLPRLKCLVLRFCWHLSEIPESIGEIPTLEVIEVDYRNMSLVESAKQINEDRQTCGNDALQVRVVHYDEVREFCYLSLKMYSNSLIYRQYINVEIKDRSSTMHVNSNLEIQLINSHKSL